MKWIKYKFNVPTESKDGFMQDNLFEKALPYGEAALQIAAEEAYNGEYEIFDDGKEENIVPTQLDRIESQVTYTAMMTDTLLEV